MEEKGILKGENKQLINQITDLNTQLGVRDGKGKAKMPKM